MNNSDSTVHPFDAADDLVEETKLDHLASDPDYWDHLDELEVEYGSCREWDDLVVVGDA